MDSAKHILHYTVVQISRSGVSSIGSNGLNMSLFDHPPLPSTLKKTCLDHPHPTIPPQPARWSHQHSPEPSPRANDTPSMKNLLESLRVQEHPIRMSFGPKDHSQEVRTHLRSTILCRYTWILCKHLKLTVSISHGKNTFQTPSFGPHPTSVSHPSNHHHHPVHHHHARPPSPLPTPRHPPTLILPAPVTPIVAGRFRTDPRGLRRLRRTGTARLAGLGRGGAVRWSRVRRLVFVPRTMSQGIRKIRRVAAFGSQQPLFYPGS